MSLDIIQEYNKYYSKDPKKWNNLARHEMIFEYIASYIDDAKTLLDIGCGPGSLVAYISNKQPDVKCTGLDFSPVAMRIASETVSNVNFVCSDILDYAPRKKFDIITVAGVAEHFDSPLEKLSYIRKLLKPRGVLYLEVPNCIAYTSYSGRKQQTEGYFRINQGSRQVEWHLLRSSWENIIADAGFKVLESFKGPQIYTEFIWTLTHE